MSTFEPKEITTSCVHMGANCSGNKSSKLDETPVLKEPLKYAPSSAKEISSAKVISAKATLASIDAENAKSNYNNMLPYFNPNYSKVNESRPSGPLFEHIGL